MLEPNTRLLPLDWLRATAIVLVLGRHVPAVPATLPWGLEDLFEPWHCGGWIGVDLFFVLSGFLVAGLLFREHQRHGTIQFGRFLLRRGLKIYPAFYAFLLITLIIGIPFERGPGRAAGEVLFLQNYLGGLWPHTWSLAVEEHFYLLLPLCLAWTLQRWPRNRFGWLPYAFVAVAITCLASRLAMGRYVGFEYMTHLFPTHLRIDSLTFGVLLSYLCHYHHERFQRIAERGRSVLITLGVTLMAPAFMFPLEQFAWVSGIGLTIFYLGAGLLLWGMLGIHAPNTRVGVAIGRLGAYSYSIYLWHLPVVVWLVPALESAGLPWLAQVLIYMVTSIVVGIGAAKAVEFPVLRLRDAWIPSRLDNTKPHTVPPVRQATPTVSGASKPMAGADA